MNLSIKTKIFLVLFFFLSILGIISFLGYRYISRFSEDSRAIAEDNFKSVQFAANLQDKLSKIHEYHIQSIFVNQGEKGKKKLFKTTPDYQLWLIAFNTQLVAAKKNVTEKAESQLLRILEEDYKEYLLAFRETFNVSAQQIADEKIEFSLRNFIPIYEKTQDNIQQLHQINMQAIAQKGKSIQETGNLVSFSMGLLGVLGVLVGSFLLFFLPGYIANPLIELNQKIQEIEDENYDQKLELKYHSQDEVGELAASFNSMALKLKQYEASNLAQVWTEKRRTEAVIQALNKALIVLDENLKVLYVNQSAQKLIGHEENQLKGQNALELADQNENFRRLANPLLIPGLFEGKNSVNHREEIQLELKENTINYQSEVFAIFKPHKDKAKPPSSLGYVILVEKLN